MATVQFIASTSFTAGNGTSIAGVAKPTGTQIGTALSALMYIEDAGTHGAYTIASTGDTWTLVGSITNTGSAPDFEIHVWRCIVANPTSTIGVTWDGDSTWRDFAVGAWSGVDPTNPLASNVTTNTGNSTTETGLDITTTEKYAHLVLATGNFDGFARSGQTSPLTERNDSGNVHFASGDQAAAGASGNKTATITSGQWATVMFAWRPDLGVNNFTGFETGDTSDALGTNGTFSIQTSIKRTGTYALRVNPSAATGAYIMGAIAAAKNANLTALSEVFATGYIYIATMPSANSPILYITNSASSALVTVMCDNSGVVTLVGTSTSGAIATLSTGQWYRFELRGNTSTTCGLSIDGGSETTVTGNAVLPQRVILGTIASATMDVYYDDCALSDDDFVTTPEVKVALPIGAGTDSSFTNGTGSTFAEVDEVPHDSGTTYLQNTAGTSVAHTLDMQAAATVGIAGTIVAVKPIAIMAEETSTSTLGGVRLRSGSVNYEHAAVDIGTTAYVAIQQVLPRDPNGWGAWDSTAFDAIEVGPFKGTDASSIRATAVYAMVLSEGAPAGATGTAAATFPGLTAAASGAQTHSGSAAATFPSLTAAATGTQTHSGVAAATFPALSAAASGYMQPTGSAAATFPALTAAASGTQSQSGSVAATFPGVTAAATGTQTHSGTASATFPGMTASATGTMQPSGAGAATFPGVTASATGTQTHSGSASATFPALTAAATGTQTHSGTANATFPALTAAASGTHTSELTGTGAATFPGVTASATGTQAQTGAAAATFPALTAAASGTHTSEATGVGAATFPAFGASATGTQTHSGSGAATLPGLSAAASGTQTQSGTASATFPGLTVSLSGTQSHSGVGAATFPTISLAGSGTQTHSGTGAATFPGFAAAGSGYLQPIGIGGATFPYLVAAAVGAHTQPGSATPVITTIYGSDGARLTLSGSETFDVIYGSDASRITVTGE